MTIHRGVSYGSRLLDLHVPEGVDAPPVVVWIHGGGFREGTRDELPWTYRPGSIWETLTAAGIACASIDYRLSQEATWPAQRDDVAAAVAFLRTHAATYGIDATRIGTWGESAGGHLALMAGLTDPDIRCVVAFYPVTDILALGHDGLDTPQAQLLGTRPSTRPEFARNASPINHVTAASPPCLFVHGDSDGLVAPSQSETMHARLIAAAADSTYRIVHGADHCFDGYADVPSLIDDAVRYLRTHLAVQPDGGQVDPGVM